eukprot:5258990-Prymnesium_polylepis.1
MYWHREGVALVPENRLTNRPTPSSQAISMHHAGSPSKQHAPCDATRLTHAHTGGRGDEQIGVEPVEQPAVAWQQRTRILDLGRALEQRDSQVADQRHDRAHEPVKPCARARARRRRLRGRVLVLWLGGASGDCSARGG